MVSLVMVNLFSIAWVHGRFGWVFHDRVGWIIER